MSFLRLEELFLNPNAAFHTRELYINADEFSITALLNDTNERFKDRVVIGSYPDFYNSYYKVKLTFESDSKASIDEVTDFLRERLPSNAIVEFDHDPINHAVDMVYRLAEGEGAFAAKVQHSVKIIEEAFDRYSWDQICVGFNGGKDCTALLHLVFAVASRKHPQEGTARRHLPALYIRRGQPFPEVELFIRRTQSRYHLDLVIIDGRIREALGQLKQSHPNIAAVFMGTRRSDPHASALADFSPTDSDWPSFMRINPILDWTYTDLWEFIRQLSLPYCTLYDRGYTSLGSLENTHPNPELKIFDSHGVVSYRPAYELKDSNSERAGRN
jgi:FAD synthetase